MSASEATCLAVHQDNQWRCARDDWPERKGRFRMKVCQGLSLIGTSTHCAASQNLAEVSFAAPRDQAGEIETAAEERRDEVRQQADERNKCESCGTIYAYQPRTVHTWHDQTIFVADMAGVWHM